jgi:4-hydroxy-3-polyprenylbenzoate decarboxylase
MNLFGSRQRLALALGATTLPGLPAAMAAFLAGNGRGIDPLITDKAPCRDIIDQPPDCDLLPALTAWPADGQPGHDGRFFTLPLVVTADPQGQQNLGLYRVACFNGAELGIHWRPGSGGARHFAAWQQAGEPMPVAIVLGADPVTTLCATLPLPDDLDELQLAGFLNGQPLELIRCLTSRLLVPAMAEVVIEGVVDPAATRNEGAFGNHTGYYGGGSDVPLVRVTAVTRRRDAILPATLVGPPPQENYWLALAGSRLLLPLLQRQVPAVVDLAFPREGIYHGAALVAIHKERPGQAREVMAALWETSWLHHARLLVLVDEDVPVADFRQVYWRALNHVVWGRDLVVEDLGNPSQPAGGRLGLDATRKLPGEENCAAWPEELAWPAEVQDLISRRWREYGFTE